jgi:membrane protein implicated in regulation of membrane protease activity
MWIWLVIAILAAIGEAVSYDLWLASVAVAALITAAVSVVLPIAALQIGIFAAISLLGIFIVRPIVKHALGIDSLAPIASAVTHRHVVGKRAVVTQVVSADGGQIRIGQGEFWTARPYELEESIGVGEPVEVVLVDGLTALVERVAPPALESSIGSAPVNAPSEKGQ